MAPCCSAMNASFHIPAEHLSLSRTWRAAFWGAMIYMRHACGSVNDKHNMGRPPQAYAADQLQLVVAVSFFGSTPALERSHEV